MTTAPEHWVSFRLNGDDFAIDAARVLEVAPYAPVTRIPGAPSFIRGAVSVRARPIPVVDLALKFGFEPAPISRWTCLVLVSVTIGDETPVLACIVDEVKELIDAPAEAIATPPPLGTRVHPRYLVGMTRSQERFVVLLDIERILSEEELALTTSSVQSAPLHDEHDPPSPSQSAQD